MNERAAKAIQGWRRPKRRKRTLIRRLRLIATDPRIVGSEREAVRRAACLSRRCVSDVAKCLRPAEVAWRDANRVDEMLTHRFQSEAALIGCPPRAPTIRAAAS